MSLKMFQKAWYLNKKPLRGQISLRGTIWQSAFSASGEKILAGWENWDPSLRSALTLNVLAACCHTGYSRKGLNFSKKRKKDAKGHLPLPLWPCGFSPESSENLEKRQQTQDGRWRNWRNNPGEWRRTKHCSQNPKCEGRKRVGVLRCLLPKFPQTFEKARCLFCGPSNSTVRNCSWYLTGPPESLFHNLKK